MTFQVSDVQIVNRRLRRTALVHSVIAFFFNVFIIAISVNVAAGRVWAASAEPAGFGRSARQAVRRRPAARAR